MAKKQFIKNHCNEISESEWYCAKAMITLNQTIGRIIRHKNDYGMVFLMDARMSSQGQMNRLSKWLSPYICISENSQEIIFSIKNFFHNVENFKIIEEEEEQKSKKKSKKKKINHKYFPQIIPFKVKFVEIKQAISEPQSVNYELIYTYFSKLDDTIFSNKILEKDTLEMPLSSQDNDKEFEFSIKDKNSCCNCQYFHFSGNYS